MNSLPKIGPYVRFGLQVLVFVAVSVTQGTLHLTHIVSPAWIDTATAYFGWAAVIGTFITTSASGLSLSTASRIQDAASLPTVSQVVTTREIAQAAGPDGVGAKIVSKAP